MMIGELARKAGVNAQTIRYYEREGILPQPRRRFDSGYREYDEDAVEQLRFIKQAQSAGFRLSDVKQLFELELLPAEACGDVQELLKRRIEEIGGRVRELNAFSKSMKRLLKSCEASGKKRCAVLEAFAGPTRRSG